MNKNYWIVLLLLGFTALPGYGQIFDDEPVVGLDQLVGDLVCEIAAPVGDVVVMAGQAGGGIGAVV